MFFFFAGDNGIYLFISFLNTMQQYRQIIQAQFQIWLDFMAAILCLTQNTRNFDTYFLLTLGIQFNFYTSCFVSVNLCVKLNIVSRKSLLIMIQQNEFLIFYQHMPKMICFVHNIFNKDIYRLYLIQFIFFKTETVSFIG